MSLERILAEEAELEKEMFGTNQESEDTSGATPELPDPDDSFIEEDEDRGPVDFPDATEVIQQEQQEVETEEEKKQRVSWKQRFKNYKASTDKTISTLRKENASLVQRIMKSEEQVDQLSLKVSTLMNSSTDIFSGVITDEDADAIGEDAVDIVKRASQKAVESSVAPLKEELNRLKAEKALEQRKQAEALKQQAYNGFLNELKTYVPDFQKIDKDVRFLEFMEGHDETTGEKRLDMFKSAEEYLDAERVADFFIEFKRTLPRSKRERLEENITPDGTSSSSNVNTTKGKEEFFTARQVEDFFNDVSKGVYRNRQKEANEIEARITKAYVEGRIR